MDELRYFAYGSNMSTRRLRQRVPSAEKIDLARLPGYRLAWHKKGGDGSGKCDIVPGSAADVVYGVLYAIDAIHKPRLDRAESLGTGYDQRHIDLWLPDRDESAAAFTYYALRIDATYLPYDWYRDHVLIGAREHGLPDYYVHLIENIPTMEDANRRRVTAERRVHEEFQP